MKKLRSYITGICLFLLFIGFIQASYGQTITPATNPVPVVPNGKSLEFKVTVSPGGIYANAYLAVTAPTDWVITGTSPAGVITNGGKNAKITFASISSDTEVSVFMKPGCIVDDASVIYAASYEFFNAGNQQLAAATTQNISNVKYPVLVFTAPADTLIKRGTPSYREWKIQQNEQDAYISGGDLTISASIANGKITGSYGLNEVITSKIIAVEMLTNTGWQTISATVAADQKSYTYTFTAADYQKIGNGDSYITKDEVIRVREKVILEYCFANENTTVTIQPKITYNLTHVCPKTKLNSGQSMVNFNTASVYTTPYATLVSKTDPVNPGSGGKIVIKLQNSNDVYFENIRLDLSSVSDGWEILKSGASAYFSDALGNKDNSAPAVTINPTYFTINFNSTTPYKGLVSMNGDNICNDLVKSSDPIYLVIEWTQLTFPNFANGGLCNGKYETFASSLRNLYNASVSISASANKYPGCSSGSFTNTVPMYVSDNLGFKLPQPSLANSNLEFDPNTGTGTQTTMTVLDSPNYTYLPNQTVFNNSTTTHVVEIILPIGLKYAPANGVKINNVAVVAADISYNADTRTLSFYNRNNASITSNLSYSYTIEADKMCGRNDNLFKISHIIGWTGYPTSYTYCCYQSNINYRVNYKEDVHNCQFIEITSPRLERATFGFKSEDMSQGRYTSLEEARSAGVNLQMAGPNDNVEFEFTAQIKSGYVQTPGAPFNMMFYYINPTSTVYYYYNINNPCFAKGTAVLQYQKQGDSNWSSPIPVASNDIVSAAEAGRLGLQVNVAPYLQAANVPLSEGTKIKIVFYTQVLQAPRVPKPASMNLFFKVDDTVHGSVDPDDIPCDVPDHDYCDGSYSNPVDFKLFDDRLTYLNSVPAADVPSSLIFYQNGGTTGVNKALIAKYSMYNNGTTTGTAEIYPFEFRPNGIVSQLTWYDYNIDVIDKIYDSEGRVFVEGLDYTITYDGSGRTIVIFKSGFNAYSGEYYNSKDDFTKGELGEHSYYIFADIRNLCVGTMSNYFNNISGINFPTSEKMEASSPSGSAWSVPPYATKYNWTISTSVNPSSASSQALSNGTFSWPLRLTNNSYWAYTANGANYNLPNTYLFIELKAGANLNDLKLYRIRGGVETEVSASWIPYTSGNTGVTSAYWIKIGDIAGNDVDYLSATSSKVDFILKAKSDCSTSGTISFAAKFGVNSTDYPTDPWSGFVSYGGCSRDIATTQLQGILSNTMLDISGTVIEHPTGTGGKYILCEDATFDVAYVNNYANSTVGGLHLKIYRGSKTALILSNPDTKLYYTQNAVRVPYNSSTWSIDDSNEDFILITLPATTKLNGMGTAGDRLVLSFDLALSCDFLFGTPIYMDVWGINSCGETGSLKNIATDDIHVEGFDDSSFGVQLNQFKIKGQSPVSDSFVFSYTQDADKILRFTGTFDVPTGVQVSSASAYITVPSNMRMKPGGTYYLTPVGGGAPKPFTVSARNRNQLVAQFDTSNPSAISYQFDIELEAYNPELWDCNTKTIIVGAMVNTELMCKGVACQTDNSVFSKQFNITLQKNDVEIVPGSVSFVESYDYDNSREKLTVKAKIRNNGSNQAEDVAFYLYTGNTPVTGTTPVLLTIAGNDVIDFEHDYTVPASEICKIRFAMPKTATINPYICDSMFVSAPISYSMDDYRMCQMNGNVLAELAVGDPAIPGYTYRWSANGVTLTDADKSITKFKYPLNKSLYRTNQTQKLTLTLTRNNDCEETIEVPVYIEPKYSVWVCLSSSYTDATAWNVAANWSNGIPGKCTYVLIPERSEFKGINYREYPRLDKAWGDPDAAKCDTIEFAFGAQVSNTYLLDYNAAKVRLNLNSDRWYMLSSPLRSMYTGDYYVDGNMYVDNIGSGIVYPTPNPSLQKYNPNTLTWGRTPDVYWMYYRMGNPETGMPYNASWYWSMPFNILDQKMEAGKGLVVWPDLETNMDIDKDPAHKKSGRTAPGDKIARFTFPRPETSYYYYNGIGFSNPRYTGPKQQGDRADNPTNPSIKWQTNVPRGGVGADGYELRSRFTYEGEPDYNPADGSFTMKAYVNSPLEPTALVGNPFMSLFDLHLFQEANSSVITNDFYIYNGSSGIFEAIKILDGNTSGNVPGLDHITTGLWSTWVAPMQSFVVVKQPDPVQFSSFKVDPSMTSTNGYGSFELRSASDLPQLLNVDLYENENRMSGFALAYNDGVSNAYDKSKDQYTLFPAEKEPMVLYALAEKAGNPAKQALSIHTIGDLSEPLPMGIQTSQRGNLLNMRVSGLESFDPSYDIYLEDILIKKMHNLRKDSTYRFTNYTGNIPEGRFYLRFIQSGTDVKDVKQSNDFYIYCDKNRQVSIYSQNDEINCVEAFNLQGQRIFAKPGLSSENYTFDMRNHAHQVVIVRVQTRNGLKSQKLMIE